MNKEIEYLKEHLYEIYKYKKSMKDLTYDMDIEHLLRTCKTLDYSQKEIERLNNIIDELEKHINAMIFETPSEKELLENILNKLKELKEGTNETRS